MGARCQNNAFKIVEVYMCLLGKDNDVDAFSGFCVYYINLASMSKKKPSDPRIQHSPAINIAPTFSHYISHRGVATGVVTQDKAGSMFLHKSVHINVNTLTALAAYPH